MVWAQLENARRYSVSALATSEQPLSLLACMSNVAFAVFVRFANCDCIDMSRSTALVVVPCSSLEAETRSSSPWSLKSCPPSKMQSGPRLRLLLRIAPRRQARGSLQSREWPSPQKCCDLEGGGGVGI